MIRLKFIFCFFILIPIKIVGDNTINNFPLYNVYKERHSLYQNVELLKKNEYLVLNFTSIACRPCKKETAELLNLQLKYNNIYICYIYSDIDKNKVIENAKERKIPEEKLQYVYTDMFGTIKSELNIKSIPHTIIIDSNYRIILSISGYSEKNITKIASLIGK